MENEKSRYVFICVSTDLCYKSLSYVTFKHTLNIWNHIQIWIHPQINLKKVDIRVCVCACIFIYVYMTVWHISQSPHIQSIFYHYLFLKGTVYTQIKNLLFTHLHVLSALENKGRGKAERQSVIIHFHDMLFSHTMKANGDRECDSVSLYCFPQQTENHILDWNNIRGNK